MRTFLTCLLLASAALAQQAPAVSTAQLTIEKICAPGGLTGRAPEQVKWSPDGKRVAYIQRDDNGENAQLWYVDPATGKPAVLVAAEKVKALLPPLESVKNEIQRDEMTRYGVAAYQWAPDSQHILFNAHGQLWLYDLGTNTAVSLVTGDAGDPKFSPDGTRLTYLRSHNLYEQELRGRARPLTRDLDPNVLNGEVDWVYKEELNARSNYFWSPDGQQIAFLQMNETAVPTYPITEYLSDHVTQESTKFPQPGDPNPTVRLGVMASSGGKVRWISVPGVNANADDFYIPRFGWVAKGVLWFHVLNRAQNQLDLYFADAKSGRTRLMLRETSPAWIDVSDDFQVLPSGDQFLWPSWRSGHNHLYLYSFDKQQPLAAEARLVRPLTEGDWEEQSVDAVDAAARQVYFTANKDDARQEQLYRVSLDGGEVQRVSREQGTHAATFPDSSAHYYVDNYSGIMMPPRMSLCETGGSCRIFWMAHDVATYHMVAPKWVDFKAADGATTLYGMLLLPEGASAMSKVPLILNPYGGPQGQEVTDAWHRETWQLDNYLAQHGFAILIVDNRGMGNRGREFAAPIREHMGEVPLADQLAALEQALKQFPALDPARVGFWGWSYGGYMTTFALTHSDAFKAGVAVAPVTGWQFYDSIYTERYMGLPSAEEQAYQRTSPVNQAAKLHGALLICHGTSDDNVHFQNTVQFVQALIKANKPYQLQIFPGKTHAIAGREDRIMLFNAIVNHFEKELK